MPVDVEVVGERRRLAVFEHVQPPCVVVAHDRDMVRHDVGDLTHAMARELGREALEILATADLGVEGGVIDDVVTVAASGASAQIRRAVDVTHSQRGEIGHQVGRLRKIEVAVQLQTVRRARDVRRAFASGRARARRWRGRAVGRCCCRTWSRGRRTAASSGQCSRESGSFRRQLGWVSTVAGMLACSLHADHVFELHDEELSPAFARGRHARRVRRRQSSSAAPPDRRRRRAGAGVHDRARATAARDPASEPRSAATRTASSGNRPSSARNVEVAAFPPTRERRQIVRAHRDERLRRILCRRLEFLRREALEQSKR